MRVEKDGWGEFDENPSGIGSELQKAHFVGALVVVAMATGTQCTVLVSCAREHTNIHVAGKKTQNPNQ